ESGMDLKGGDTLYHSFRAYQNKLLREYASMADEFHFRTVDARRSIQHIQEELRKQVTAFLEEEENVVWVKALGGEQIPLWHRAPPPVHPANPGGAAQAGHRVPRRGRKASGAGPRPSMSVITWNLHLGNHRETHSR